MKNKETLKSRILKYVRNNGAWINGGEIERLTLGAGYKASTGSRICRKLAEDGVILAEIRNGSVWYKTKPPLKVEKIYGVLPNGDKTLIKTKTLWE